MVPIANRPVMSYAIEILAQFGVKDIVVSLFHSGALIESYFGDGRRWGVNLDYVLQREPWGTAGALYWAKHALHDTFIVIPADSIFEVNVEALIDFHQVHRSTGTAVLQEINNNQNQGIHPRDEEYSPTQEDSSIERTFCETGVYLFEPQVLDFIPPRRKIGISDYLLPTLSEAGHSITEYKTCCYWNALDTFECYLEAQKYFLNQNQGNGSGSVDYSLFSEFQSSRLDQITKGVWVGKNSVVHPSTQLIPPVRIGENSRIGPNVEVGPNSVIGANVVIDAGATVKESTLLDDTYIGQLVNIERRLVYKRLVIDLTTAQSIEVPDQLIVGQTFRAISDSSLRRIADLFFAGACIVLCLPLALLLSVISYFFSKKFFEWVPALGTRIKPSGKSSHDKEYSFNLLRFPIQNKDRKPTWFGQLIKRLDWQRIPELWNVIIGDISMVGVMPLSPGDRTRLNEPWQKSRNVCFPGFTGLWYTQAANMDDLDDLLITDAYYAATRNWKGDIKIILKTCIVWIKKLGAIFG